MSVSLAAPDRLPLRSIAEIAVKTALVVAPHPDDECLGCGGAIALLRQQHCDVQILVVSDGTKSHPNSRKFPTAALQSLRESETRSAMQILGVDPAAVTFLQLQDGAVPSPDRAEFTVALQHCCDYLQQVQPQLIFLPWRFDPHPDHRASWQLIQTALAKLQAFPRLLEYPIWDWDLTQRGTMPELIAGWRLDICEMVQRKQQAISAYRSQISDLIDDDPDGFRLSAEMLQNFDRSWELYLEDLSSCVH